MSAQLEATAEVPSQGHRLAADEARAAGEVTRFPTGLNDVPTDASDPWLFVQLADPQLGMLNSDQDDGTWDEETATLTKAVEQINRLKPKFAIVCGDLVHEFPENVGEKGNDARKAKQTRSLQSALSRVDSSIGLVCLCGNHDIGNVPSRKSIRDFRNNYGEDYGMFRCGDHRCVVINSQLVNSKETFWQELRKDQCAEIEPVARQQDNWLDSLPPDEPSLIFSHVPPFLFADDEPKGYFNHEPAVRRHLLAQIRRLDKRAKWFCGHFHRNAGGFSGELEVVVTSAVGCALAWKADVSEGERLGLDGFDWKKRGCSEERSGLRLVCVHGRDVKHRFFSLKDVPEDPLMESEAW